MSTTLEEIVLTMRRERDQLLSRPYRPRLTRHDYAALLATGEIKLITGPRRAGKSTLALMMLRGRNFAYLNFDNRGLLDLWDEAAVMAALDRVYPGYDYLLLDEVQNLPGWDLWVSGLYRRGTNLVITGSNAKMLSSEMATALTGRYLPIDILPLSLEEALLWQQPEGGASAEREAIADEYLRLGGFPETIGSRPMTETYLSTLFDAIVLKDIAMRHKVRHTGDLNRLAVYLVSNIARPMSYRSIMSAVGLASVSTTQKFVDYMMEPYLFYFLPRYDHKLRLMNRAPRKVYITDNGLITAKAFSTSPDLGRLLENSVFTELLRRGYKPGLTLFYYRSRTDREVDFVTRRGTAIDQVIQVCYDLTPPKTRKRELDSLVECADELRANRLTVITRRESGSFTHKGHPIRVVSILE